VGFTREEQAMTDPTPGGVPDDKYRQPPDVALGGADAVEKTTYVTGSGTEPERSTPAPAVQQKGSGTGPSATWAIIVFLAVGAILVYVLGLGT
jgi:hypothetical protein